MRQKVKMPISLQGMHIDLQTARLLDILERGKHRAMKEERILQITLLATLAFLPVYLGIVVTTGIKPRSQSPLPFCVALFDTSLFKKNEYSGF